MVISIAATGVPSLIIEGSQGLSKSSNISSLCADEVKMARGQRGTRQETLTFRAPRLQCEGNGQKGVAHLFPQCAADMSGPSQIFYANISLILNSRHYDQESYRIPCMMRKLRLRIVKMPRELLCVCACVRLCVCASVRACVHVLPLSLEHGQLSYCILPLHLGCPGTTSRRQSKVWEWGVVHSGSWSPVCWGVPRCH